MTTFVGLRSVWNRIYTDFLLPNRLAMYGEFLRLAFDSGYESHSVVTFLHLVRTGSIDSAKLRCLVLRHDVDSDIGTARSMWEIEQAVGARSSFYFRLSTLDVSLMRAIEEAGGEASYHYEELATLAKRRRVRGPEQMSKLAPQARELFARNLDELRQLTSLPMVTVASHGDFVNRRFDVPNHILLADRSFRERMGILAETYDEEIMRPVGVRCADAPYPRFWNSSDPFDPCRRGVPVVYVLTHPRNWRACSTANAVLACKRVAEELSFRYPFIHR